MYKIDSLLIRETTTILQHQKCWPNLMRERELRKMKHVSFETMLRICGPKANETKCKAAINREYNTVHTLI